MRTPWRCRRCIAGQRWVHAQMFSGHAQCISLQRDQGLTDQQPLLEFGSRMGLRHATKQGVNIDERHSGGAVTDAVGKH